MASRTARKLSLFMLQIRCCLSTIEARVDQTTIKSFCPPSSIKCILSDMDGTLLNSDHQIEDRTIKAISAAMNEGYSFFPCTGRSRKSMAAAAGSRFINLFGKTLEDVPGVYQQGLTVYGPNKTIIYERFLDNNVITRAVEFCSKNDIAVIAYAGDEIYTQKRCYYSSKITEFQEPHPTVFPDGLDALLSSNIKVNKLILLDDEIKLIKIRPSLHTHLGDTATLTKAVPGMLEILPPGASKGYGVEQLLKYYSISSEDVIAFGDGENDIEMLQLVKYGIAVENAREELKKVAFHITASNNDHGVASIIESLLNRDQD